MTTHEYTLQDTDRAASAEGVRGAVLSAEISDHNSGAVNADWRLHKHADYQRVYKQGRKQFGQLLTYFHTGRSQAALQETFAGPRIGLTVGKVLGKAVDRNRIKRRMREAVRRQLHQLTADVDLVLHPKRSVLDAGFERIDREVERTFAAVQNAMQAGTSIQHEVDEKRRAKARSDRKSSASSAVSA